MNEKDFIELIGKKAVNDYNNIEILPSITIAQACLESGYGKEELAVNANNLFGMKCNLSGNTWKSVWNGVDKYAKKTNENYNGQNVVITAEFRKYPNIDKSITDHSLYLSQAKNGSKLRYQGLLGEKDYKKAITIIKNGGYATDPKYIDKICKVIEKWNLTRFDAMIMNNEINIINAIDNKYVPKWGNEKKYIAIHYLGVVGQNHKILSNHCGAHFYIYWDGTTYQAVDYDAIVYQVGTAGYYKKLHPYANNSNCIGIEMCVKCDGNSKSATDPYWYFTEETQIACVKLVKYLMKKFNIPKENVLRHGDIVSKYCPAPYLTNNRYKTSWTWDEFKAKLDGIDVQPKENYINIANSKQGIIVTTNDLNIRTVPSNGKVIGSLKKNVIINPTQRTIKGDYQQYWFKIDNGWVSGKYLVGWVFDLNCNKWWYIENGKAITDTWKWINNDCYYFMKDGYLATSSYIKCNDKYCWVNKDGVWEKQWDVIDVHQWNVIE